MSIERATIDDAQEILVLQKLAYTSKAEIYDDFTIEPLHQTLEEIRAEFESAQAEIERKLNKFFVFRGDFIY